ncbi:MAG: Transcription elongation factor GreA [Candidatus Levybacteria bacterium GW2011_GWC2_37_7]|nr:MAG: Transcription elongation factor GreA [Candidatus Levybacteria bacterium GW2011_GWC2_37_7]
MDNNKKIYLTKEGSAELKKEYDELVNVKRVDVLTRVAQSRNMGDLSENAEYVASREELTFIDGRIDELEIILKQAVIIRDTKTSNHAIKLGSTVTLHINGKKEIFTVVGEWEADPENKKISHESPLGKVLLNKKVGEKVQVEAPAGKITYSIVAVK